MTAAYILGQSGFPGGTPVRVASAEQAVNEAARLGYPVVVKPIDADGGRGVWADLRSPGDVLKAFEAARSVSEKVMVDRHIDGTGHRFTIMFGKVAKVTAKLPWGVRGDGTSTIDELVRGQQAQLSEENAHSFTKVPPSDIDDEALSLLRQYGLARNSVPAAGQFIPLRRRNNANAGGSTVRLELDMVHGDNLALALRVADLFMLDVAGIDLIIPDISRSWLEQVCLICDVNSQPQVGAAAAAEFLEAVLPGNGRIAVTLVLVSADQVRAGEPGLGMLAKALEVDGISSSEGIWINECQVGRAGMDGHKAASALFSNRDVFNSAIAMSISDIHAFGLPADRFQRLVIVRPASPEAPNAGLEMYRAGESSRESIERAVLDSALVQTSSEAASFIEKIWPHFVPDFTTSSSCPPS